MATNRFQFSDDFVLKNGRVGINSADPQAEGRTSSAGQPRGDEHQRRQQGRPQARRRRHHPWLAAVHSAGRRAVALPARHPSARPSA